MPDEREVLNARIRNCKNEIATLERKIYRLNSAIEKIKGIKSDANNTKEKAAKKKVENNLTLNWKGDKYEAFVKMIDEDNLGGDLKGYVKNIDSILDNITWTRTSYQNQILSKTTILSGLWTALNNLGTSIETTFN